MKPTNSGVPISQPEEFPDFGSQAVAVVSEIEAANLKFLDESQQATMDFLDSAVSKSMDAISGSSENESSKDPLHS